MVSERDSTCIEKVAAGGVLASASSVCEPAKQVKKAPGVFYILCDLGAQGVNGGKLDFVAQPLQKMDFYFGLRRQLYRMKVQQVSFHSEGISPESGTIADVGDGIETLLCHSRAGDVHTVLG